jgi:hypothetical protein
LLVRISWAPTAVPVAVAAVVVVVVVVAAGVVVASPSDRQCPSESDC